jgi:aspartokinase
MSQNKNIIVLKFGGTSQLKSTYDLIINKIKSNNKNKYIIIMSAISGITTLLLSYSKNKNITDLNRIIELNNGLADNCNVDINDIIDNLKLISQQLNSTDEIVSFVAQGEFFTCNILNRYLNNNEIKSEFISSLDIIDSNQENLLIIVKYLIN